MDEKLLNKLRQSLNANTGGNHFSPTQLLMSIQLWMIKYLCSSKDMRKENKANYKMWFGVIVNNVVQKFLGKIYYMSETNKQVKLKKRKLLEIYEEVLSEIKLEEARDERDKLCRKAMTEYLMPTIQNVIKAFQEIFGDEDIECERTVYETLDNLFIDVLGRIDGESKTKLVELKIKPINFRNTKKGLTAQKQALPDLPDRNHLAQTGFYQACTGKDAYIVYANHEEYRIFKPDVAELNFYHEKMLDQAMTIQRLLLLSKGDASEMAKYVEAPDLSSFYFNDLTEEQLNITKQLWRI